MPSTSNNTCSLGSYLGMVDLWYDCNVCSLGQMIPDLARTVCQKMGRCLAYLPYLGKKNEHTCMFSWVSHSVWNEEVWKFLSVFFLTFPCVNAKLATVHCEKHVPLANFAYTLIFPKLLGCLLIYILRSLWINARVNPKYIYITMLMRYL